MHTFYNLSQERFEVIMLELYVHRGRMGGGKQWWGRHKEGEERGRSENIILESKILLKISVIKTFR